MYDEVHPAINHGAITGCPSGTRKAVTKGLVGVDPCVYPEILRAITGDCPYTVTVKTTGDSRGTAPTA